MRSILIGEVRTAEHALRGMVRAGHAPVAMYTTDVDAVMAKSQMAPDYYCDLVKLGAAYGVPTLVVESDLTDVVDQLAALRPDYIWVMGWPYIVGDHILDLAPCVGMHPTRLPKRRGGAPMNWTIIDGETSSAVTLFRLREGIDDGEIFLQRDFPIGENDYVDDVARRVYCVTEQLVADAVRLFEVGNPAWIPQEHAQATYTRRRKPSNGRIDWNESAIRIRNLVRAVSHPFPGAFTCLEDVSLKVWRAEPPIAFRAPVRAIPGTILEVSGHEVTVATGDNAIHLTEVEPAEEASLTGGDLSSRFSSFVGAVLGLEA